MNFSFNNLPHYQVLCWFRQLLRALADYVIRFIWSTHIDQSPDSKRLDNRVDQYCTAQLQKFMKVYDSDGAVYATANSSIDPLFYSKDEYKSAMEIYDNEYEKAWKRRVLIDSTPRGNVVMYYDPFKMGYSYYSDQHIPYSVLNAVAMKYSTVYRCADFFMDEFVIPHTYTNRLIQLHKGEEKPNAKDQSVPDYAIDKEKLKSAPFAKLKNYNGTSGGVTNAAATSSSGRKGAALKKEQMNLFLHLGKISNYSAIQRTPKANKLNGFSSSLLNAKKISWRDFKAATYKQADNTNIAEDNKKKFRPLPLPSLASFYLTISVVPQIKNNLLRAIFYRFLFSTAKTHSLFQC